MKVIRTEGCITNTQPMNEWITMDLTSQIKALVDGAPTDDGTKQLVENVAIALARWVNANLIHSHYYLIQDASSAWIRGTFIHRTQSVGEKTAIFSLSRPHSQLMNHSS